MTSQTQVMLTEPREVAASSASSNGKDSEYETGTFFDRTVLVAGVLNERPYVGCPHCSKKYEELSEGATIECSSEKCSGKKVSLARLTMWSLLAGDPRRTFILSFLPFLCKLEDAQCLMGKEIAVQGVVSSFYQNHCERQPIVKVFGFRIIRDLLAPPHSFAKRIGGPQDAESTSPQEETKRLKELLEKQPTEEKRLGLNLEILGRKAREDLSGKFDAFSSRWNGITAYLGQEPQKGADFVDSFGCVSQTDEYKNTSGNYYLCQYVKNPDKDHYTVGATKSDDATNEYLASHGSSCLTIGQQINEFPLDEDGSVKRKFSNAFCKIKTDIIRRVISPLLQFVGGTSNSQQSALVIATLDGRIVPLQPPPIDGGEGFADIRIGSEAGLDECRGEGTRGFAGRCVGNFWEGGAAGLATWLNSTDLESVTGNVDSNERGGVET
jgi:hypothetical protein